MKNRCPLGLRPLPFVSCLLTGAVFAAAPIQAVPVAQAPQPRVQTIPATPSPQPPASQSPSLALPSTSTPPASGQPVLSATTLTIQDLPPGFKEIPPEIQQQISSRLDPFKQALARDNIQLDKFFAFINPDQFQVVFGFTGVLPSQPQQAKFDATVQNLQRPEVLQQQMGRLQERLKSSRTVKIVSYKSLPDLNRLANASTGLTVQFDYQGQPLQVDLAGFRRNQVGAFTGVLYSTKSLPQVAVKDVATKLDTRILQVSPAASR